MTPETDRIKLVVAGREREEWTSYSISSDLDVPSGRFDLRLNDYQARFSREITGGEPCRVYCNGKLIMTGFIDDAQSRVTKQRREFVVTGRDRAGILVDCTPEPQIFMGQTLAQIAAKVGKLFGVTSIRVEGDGGKPIAKCQIIAGQTAWAFLAAQASKQKLGLWMDPAGTLVIGQPKGGSASAVLRHSAGQNRQESNVEEITIYRSTAESYTSVTVLAQGQGNDWFVGSATSEIRATIEDPELKSRGVYRPLIITDSQCADQAQARARAEREMNRGKLAGLKVEIVVKGHGPEGRVWTPGQVVAVNDETSGFRREMMIMGRTLRRDRSGARTNLRLHLPGVWP